MDSIGKRIRIARQANGYTQQQLATKLGCNINTVSRWEHDKYSPSVEDLNKISDILGINLNEDSDTFEKEETTMVELSLEDIRLEVANNEIKRMKTMMITIVILIILFFSMLFFCYTFLANRIDPNAQNQPIKMIYYVWEGEE